MSLFSGISAARDHPRVCGEKAGRARRGARPLGSPPRVRGKVGRRAQRYSQSRITPACAGKSVCFGVYQELTRDHPRVCGEKDKAAEKAQHLRGSPPHMRGKGQNQRGTGSGRGITPAYAGKSTHQPPSGRGTRGHPRVCGEKCGYRLPFRSIVGSPPTVRGKVAGNLEQGRVVGITPACAGKSHADHHLGNHRRDYPRVCGEKVLCTQPLPAGQGSPPRVRGKGWQDHGTASGRGITPACAGKRDSNR